MSKKKGFTLVEILAVIALLAILMVIAVPSIMKMSGRMKSRGLTSKLDSIKEAAVNYTQSHSNQIKSQLLGANSAPACDLSVATTLNSEENVWYVNGTDGKRWCECDNGSKSGEDCKFVFYMTVNELIEKGAFASELADDSSSVCDVADPTSNNRCLDCLVITIKLDDKYKSADAYISDKAISDIPDKETCH